MAATAAAIQANQIYDDALADDAAAQPALAEAEAALVALTDPS